MHIDFCLWLVYEEGEKRKVYRSRRKYPSAIISMKTIFVFSFGFDEVFLKYDNIWGEYPKVWSRKICQVTAFSEKEFNIIYYFGQPLPARGLVYIYIYIHKNKCSGDDILNSSMKTWTIIHKNKWRIAHWFKKNKCRNTYFGIQLLKETRHNTFRKDGKKLSYIVLLYIMYS